MSLRFVILGLLAEQPRHGYAIQAELEQRFGDLCEPSYGEVYRVLSALARSGLVVGASARIGKRPHRKVYALSSDGRRALRQWLLDATTQQPRGRDELSLRLLLAERCAPELLSRVVEVRGRSARAELGALRELQAASRPGASFTALVRALHLESELRQARVRGEVIDLCRAMLGRYQADTTEAATASETPLEARAAVPAQESRRRQKPGRTPRT